MNYKKTLLTVVSGLILVGCGGGGAALPHANISVAGLAVGKSVTLGLVYTANSTETAVTASGTSAVSPDLVHGGYTVKVIRHPQRQLCRVVDGSSFEVSSANVAVSVECHVTYLNDTGVTDTTTALSGVDGEFGRDAAVQRGESLDKIGGGKSGFDFTKICADGQPVSSTGVCKTQTYTNEWACTQDNVTRLMWDIRSFGATDPVPAWSTSGPSTWCGVPTENWRLPTVHELISIVDSSFVGAGDTTAKVDATYFPNIVGGIYRAGEKDFENKDWYVDLQNYGTASITPTTGNVLYVAALQDSRVNAGQDFTVTDDNSGQYVIVDGGRDLVWLFEKAPQATTWAQALGAVTTVNSTSVGGHSDWRLPNKNELDSLMDRTKASPTVYAGMLNGVDQSVYSSAFWSNTKWFETASVNVWRVDFTTGDITLEDGGVANARAVYVRNRVTAP